MKDKLFRQIRNLYRINADAWHMFFSSFSKYKKFDGDYQEICERIIKGCWNGRYFQTSSSGFSEFWMRDFAYCAESLVALGYSREVRETLIFALEHYEKFGAIRTKISRNGQPVDIFDIAPDSLALLILSLIRTDNGDLAKKHKVFLNSEISRYYENIVDESAGLVRGGYLSSVKDHSVRQSSTYDNSMIAYLAKNLDELGLANPFKKFDWVKKIREKFWTGSYFKDNLESDDVTGDANIYPYWLGIFDDRLMMEKSFTSMERAGLADPFPLKYSSHRRGVFVKLINFFTPNYQGDTIWLQNGLIYLRLLEKTNQKKFQKYFGIYKGLIEHNKNFIEVFHSNGQTYRTPFYKADEALLWCSMFLDLARKKDDHETLLQLARAAIESKLSGEKLDISEFKLTPTLKKKGASFVTLTANGKLRGCMGDLAAKQSLYENVIENARNAAFADSRFAPLRGDEINKIKIEISVLSKLTKLIYTTPKELIDILKSKHPGVFLSKKSHSATFLPQVWEELSDPESFLSELCLKAGLPASEWQKDVIIETYTVEEIK
ncbi:MAG: AmmeMemoRadiSam system protein A [Candidatus Berkelbacteria bacterium]